MLDFNIMAQGAISQRYRYYLSLAAPGAGNPAEETSVGVRNALDRIPAVPIIRPGAGWDAYIEKFGLYNERLDATPTFIGIEAPEMFDFDHLLLTRTTNFMIHGQIPLGSALVNYAAMTGNDERAGGQIPLGLDLNLDLSGVLRLGSSFYSTNGDAVPSHGVGDGPPIGGVATWMESDQYQVYGGYAEVTADGFILQTEFWQAAHSARRSEEQVALLADAGLNDRQLARFGLDDGEIATRANYTVQTFYLRTGYSIQTDLGVLPRPWEITPYAQLDSYSNPESIASKSFGGDNEAGLSDDGLFYKATAGVRVRPTPAVAIKIDGSSHVQQFNGNLEYYPEIRVSASYFWEMGGR